MKRLSLALLALALCAVTAGPVGLLQVGSSCVALPGSFVYQDANLSQGSWVSFGSLTQVVNAAPAPDCTNSASSLTEDTSTGPHQLIQFSMPVIPAGARTLFVYAKQSVETRSINLQWQDTGGAVAAQYNLTTCALSNAGPASGTWSAASGSAAKIGANGFCKIAVNVTTAGGLTTTLNIFMTDATQTQNYTGDGLGAILVWGVTIQ